MMNTKQQLEVYGMTIEDIREDYMDSITARLSGMEMVVMGILSDVQHVVPNNETARKQLNVAKYILAQMMARKITQPNG